LNTIFRKKKITPNIYFNDNKKPTKMSEKTYISRTDFVNIVPQSKSYNQPMPSFSAISGLLPANGMDLSHSETIGIAFCRYVVKK